MYNIGICDDVNCVCSYIEDIILEYSRVKKRNINVEVWYSGEGLYEYFKQGNDLDVLYLDIELFQINGIQIAEYIRNTLENRSMQIIYISGKDSYAYRLFKTQPMDFLVKPIKKRELFATMDLAFKILNKESAKFRFQYGKEFYSVPYEEILYFSSDKRKIEIVTKAERYYFYGKLKDLINNLPKDFIVIHQSYIINTQCIIYYTYDNVKMLNKDILPISSRYRRSVRAYLLECIK